MSPPRMGTKLPVCGPKSDKNELAMKMVVSVVAEISVVGMKLGAASF